MQKEVKEKIKSLVGKYERIKISGKLKSYTEEETKKDFILPFFSALGWNVYDKNEVSAEENISSGRVDYGFYFNDRIKFYLEVKKLTADLHREDFANQAIRYSWNKGATWAVLTDFESIKLFNAQDIEKSLADKLFFEIPYTEYIKRFEQLTLLTKESFKNGLLDKEAEKYGKKLQKVSVNALLYKDLQKCRDILTKSLGIWNEKVPKDLLDEGVQKLLDRLIFLRVAEDRGIEPPTLIPMIRQWQASGRKGSIYTSMIQKFRELDKVYNSNLFSEHPFEKWEEYDNITEQVVNILYGKRGYYEYDFRAMPADVLGSVYENYLGYRLSQSKKGLTVGKDAKKRKEQGIYYTPDFIVDYIVKNALGPVLDKCKSVADLKKIKVLDPACGSGSFLVKALEMISNKYEDFNVRGDVYTKLQILLENIYGVDLDEQAVEIARLNLLINALDERTKLPLLSNNIKNGNSLISGTDEELKKYFGKNFRDKKPFSWQENFPEVFKNGGFDVIIGNPPYIDSEEMTKSQPDFRNYCVEKYAAAKGNWDLFCIFIERGINVLKKSGILGMIVPNKLISAKYALATRDILSSNGVLAIADYSSIAVFGASVYPIVVIAGKGKEENYKLEVTVNHGVDFPTSSSTRVFSGNILTKYKDSWAPLFEERGSLDFLDRIIHQFPKLEEVKSFSIVGAATVSEAYEIKKIIREMTSGQNDKFKFINTGAIDRYCSLWSIKPTRYIKSSYNKPSLSKSDIKKVYPRRYAQANSPKIIIGGMSKFLECFLDEDGQYMAGKSTTIILGENPDSLKILLGILNSKVVSCIYSHIFNSLSLAGGFFRIGTPQIKLLPISLPDKKVAKILVRMVNKMIAFNRELNEASENSNEWNELKVEIEKTDKRIDEEVYNLYELTEKEIKIVESIK